MNGDGLHTDHQKTLVCYKKKQFVFQLKSLLQLVAFSFWECFAELDLSFLSSSNSRTFFYVQDEHIHSIRALLFL